MIRAAIGCAPGGFNRRAGTMIQWWFGVGAALLLVGGCGKKADTNTAAVTTSTTSATHTAPKEAAPPEPAATPGAARVASKPPAAPVAIAPTIAYTYAYRFRVPAKHLAEVQRAHQAICEALGPTRCVIVNASIEGRDGGFNAGSLQLRVAPDLAPHFGDRLTAVAAKADGALIGSQVRGEDLTKQVVDAEAGLKARTALRDRLQQLLEHRDGKLADLLEVEQALAQTQGELDAATGLLAELHQRLAMSEVNITYESDLPTIGEDRRPIANALGNVRDVFSTSLSFVITATAALLPFAAVGALVWLAFHLRRRARRRDGG